MTVPVTSKLPSTIEAEIALLGAVLVNNDAFDTAAKFVSPEDFEDGLNRKIWELVEQRRADGLVANPVTLRTILGNEPIGDITVGQYLARLAAEVVTVSDAPDYARIVREGAQRRQILQVANDLRDLTLCGTRVTDIAAEGIARLDAVAVAASPTSTPRVTIGEAAGKGICAMREAIERGGRISGITTGFREFDNMTNGLQKGELHVGAARPGMGKSALAEAIGVNASKAGHGALFISLEMKDVQLGMRALADVAYDPADPIAYDSIRRGRVSEDHIWRVEQAKKRLDALPFLIEQEANLTVSQIAARARKVKADFERRGKTLDLLIIDHLHIIKPAQRRSSTVDEISEVCRDLKALAKNLDVALLCLCQLNRNTEGRDDKKPTLADLRGSGAIEQDAGLVFFLYRPAYYLSRQKFEVGSDRETKRLEALIEHETTLEVIIAKQREGQIGPVDLFCVIGCNVIRDRRRV